MMTKQDMQGQYAGFVTRLGAWLIDRGIIAAVMAASAWLVNYLLGVFGLNITECYATPGWEGYVCVFVSVCFSIFALTFGPLYLIVFWTLAGATPGKVAAGIRIVRMDGKPMSLRRSFRRWLGYMMSFFALGAGFLLILISDRRQGWDDKFAHTCVVYSWEARQNERLIKRMTKKLFRSQKRIDHYSEELRGKTIYGTDQNQDAVSATDSAESTSSSDTGLESQDVATNDVGTLPGDDSTTAQR